MIDPIIFTIELGSLKLDFHWYGVLVVVAIMVSAWIAEREIARRGGKSDWIWDGLLWVLPAAIIGSRAWYVLNDILGGGRTFLDEPIRIIKINEGGLHIFGAIVFGLLAAYIFAKRNDVDLFLLLDSAAPSLLIGQALARPANYINQELYGPPTDLPWGISILGQNRIAPWDDLELYPEATTRFHPAFAYEMLWNLIAAGLILWLVRKYKRVVRPGTAFALWLVLAGVGRALIEAFRPDQPRIPGTVLSYSRLVAIVMAIVGVIWLLVRYEIIRLPFLSPGPEAYRLPKKKHWKTKKTT